MAPRYAALCSGFAMRHAAHGTTQASPLQRLAIAQPVVLSFVRILAPFGSGHSSTNRFKLGPVGAALDAEKNQ